MRIRSLAEIERLMRSGAIRTFAEQSDFAAVQLGGNCTELETEARLFYLRHILSNTNPRRLP